VRGRFDDEQSIGIATGAHQLLENGSAVEREADVTVLVGHRHRRHHHPGAEMMDQETVVTKERRHVLDVGAPGHQGPFVPAKEIHAVVHVGMEKDVRGAKRQTAAEGEVLPVTAFSKRPKERDRRAGDDAEADRVARSYERRGLLDGHLARFHRTILHEPTHCATI